MKRIFVLVLSLVALISPMSLSAQELSKTNPAPISFADYVTNSFINYYTTGGVQEKLYMVTDKPFYSGAIPSTSAPSWSTPSSSIVPPRPSSSMSSWSMPRVSWCNDCELWAMADASTMQ
jgi:hypothetical protein